MASLTDVIFLLLIFFMLTSTVVSPNALKLLLPSSNKQVQSKTSVSVSITKDLEYYVNEKRAGIDDIKGLLMQQLQGREDPVVVLNADKTVPIDNVVQVMNIGNDLNVKMILATKAE